MGMKNEIKEASAQVEVQYLFIKKGGFTEPAELYIIGEDHKAYMVPNELILRLLKNCVVISRAVTDRRRKRKIQTLFTREGL